MKTILFPIVRDFNVVIGSLDKLEERQIVTTIFGNEIVNHFEEAIIYDILVVAGCFESKSQARKNWTGVKEIPTGYNEIGPIGKQKLMLFIWNPTEEV